MKNGGRMKTFKDKHHRTEDLDMPCRESRNELRESRQGGNCPPASLSASGNLSIPEGAATREVATRQY